MLLSSRLPHPFFLVSCFLAQAPQQRLAGCELPLHDRWPLCLARLTLCSWQGWGFAVFLPFLTFPLAVNLPSRQDGCSCERPHQGLAPCSLQTPQCYWRSGFWSPLAVTSLHLAVAGYHPAALLCTPAPHPALALGAREEGAVSGVPAPTLCLAPKPVPGVCRM